MTHKATRSTLDMGKAPVAGGQTLSIHEKQAHVLTGGNPSKNPPLMPYMGGLSYAPIRSGWCLTVRQTGRRTLAADSPGTAVRRTLPHLGETGRGCEDSRERRRGYVKAQKFPVGLPAGKTHVHARSSGARIGTSFLVPLIR